jgi:hypothetical protein
MFPQFQNGARLPVDSYKELRTLKMSMHLYTTLRSTAERGAVKTTREGY